MSTPAGMFGPSEPHTTLPAMPPKRSTVRSRKGARERVPVGLQKDVRGVPVEV